MRFRSEILLWSLLSIGGLIALLSIVQIWGSVFDADDFLKALITLVVIGFVLSFTVAVDYDLPSAQSRIGLYVLSALIAIGAGVSIIQLWWTPFPAGVFVKILGTIVIFAALAGFIQAARADLGRNKRLRDGNYID